MVTETVPKPSGHVTCEISIQVKAVTVPLLQVHAFGGTAGVLFYSLMASKNYVYELYGRFSAILKCTGIQQRLLP